MLVSVIMPTYNSGKYIVEAIESVIRQTITDWEIQIVDDCSTDDTYEKIEKYLDTYPQIHYYRLPANSGPAVARTEAIRRAIGKYIAFLDSDDIWDEKKLEKQIAFMEKNKSLFCCTAYRQIEENGKSLNMICVPPKYTDYWKMIKLSNPIGNLTVMYNQNELGKYIVPEIKKRNDFALWLQILKDVRYCEGMQEVLATYRIRSNSVSRHKILQTKYHWQLYYKIEKLGLFKSCFAMFCWAIVKGFGIGLNKLHSCE